MDSDPLLINSVFLTVGFLSVVSMVIFFLSMFSLFMVAVLHLAELSFFSLSSKELNQIKKKAKPNSRTFLRYVEKPKTLLATLRVAQLFFSLFFVISFYFLAQQMMMDLIENGLIQLNMHSGLISLICGIISFALLFFVGVSIPRVQAINKKLNSSLFAANFMGGVAFLFGGFGHWLAEKTSFLTLHSTDLLHKEMSTEELHETIEQGRNYAASIEEVNIFKSILKFDEVLVKQIMKPRTDIIALNAAWDFNQVKNIITEQGFSRMPVFEENLDKVVGVIHTKDLLSHIDEPNFDWKQVMRKPNYVPDTKYAESLLKEFQLSRNHMAIVVNEFGGTSGLVTLEDIMEEIIGNIQDEFDDDELFAKKIDDFNFIFEGKTAINDACRFASLAVDTFDGVKGQSDSVAGLVLELAGKFPRVNETITLGNYQFNVLSLNNQRIESIKLTILSEITV